MEHGSRTRLLSGVVIAVVFASGVLIGLAADSSLEAEPPESVVAESTEEEREEEPRRTPMWRQVDPSPQQLVRIDSIVAIHRERTNALDKETRRAYRDGFRTIVLETREAIKDVFSEEQASEYQRLLDEWDAQQAAEREARRDRK